MNNPINNKNLNDLLKKATPIDIGAESLDDFEKDALQGFGTLESPEEALELKSQLDKKIYAKVFTEKKSEVKVYWYAAAGLFLVIGFSVFFLLTNTNSDTKSKLALIQKEEKANQELQPNPLQTPEQVSELDKKQITAADAVPPVETKGKTKSAGDKTEETVAFGASAKGPGNSAVGNIVATTAAEKADDSENKNNNQQGLALNEPSGGKDSRASKADKSASDDYKRLEGEREDAKDLQDKLSDNKTQHLTKEEIDDLKAEQKKETASARKKEKSKSPAKSKDASELDRDESKNAESGSLANNGRNNETNIPATEKKPDDNKKLAEKPANSTPASTAQPKVSGGLSSASCYYSGGEDVLKKDISEKLNAMRINKKFEAILFINEKKEIEKVSFTKLFDLTKDDETHIAESLKSLNKFKFINTPEKGLFEYKLVYNP